MYDALKKAVLWVMRVPAEPHDPMGDVQALRVFRPAIAYLHYHYLFWAIGELIAGGFFSAMAIGFFLDPSETAQADRPVFVVFAVLGTILFVLQAAFTFFVVRLDYEMRWYKITDRSLRIREGVTNVHELTMTFANIQNITVLQGPLQRMFSISDVKVETAGGGGVAVQQQRQRQPMLNLHIGTFRGVSNAEEIRDLMMQRLRRLRDTGIGDTDQATTMDTPRPPAVVPAPSLNWGANGAAIIASLRQEAALLRQAAEACGRR
jgi:membrane protein YdbS with pleckstrin-like domain